MTTQTLRHTLQDVLAMPAETASRLALSLESLALTHRGGAALETLVSRTARERMTSRCEITLAETRDAERAMLARARDRLVEGEYKVSLGLLGEIWEECRLPAMGDWIRHDDPPELVLLRCAARSFSDSPDYMTALAVERELGAGRKTMRQALEVIEDALITYYNLWSRPERQISRCALPEAAAIRAELIDTGYWQSWDE